MTQEEKELLLQDLSARFPYGVIVRHADYLIDSDGNYTGQFWYKRGYLCNICKLDNMTTTIIESEGSDEEGHEHICDLERSLPYLRPMSSMTTDEEYEYYQIRKRNSDKSLSLMDCNDHLQQLLFPIIAGTESIDWLNAHHLDYRGLIPMNLALEAPEGMYE